MTVWKNPHPATLHDERTLRELPLVLANALEEYSSGTRVVKWLEDIDGAVVQAADQCDDLGNRLVSGLFAQIMEFDDDRLVGEINPNFYLALASASRAALSCFIRDERPADMRAQAGTRLAIGLCALGDMSLHDDQAREMLESAIEHAEESIRVITKDEHPAEWLCAHEALANSLRLNADRVESSADRRDLLERVVEAVENALTVDTKLIQLRQLPGLQLAIAAASLELSNYIKDESAVSMLARAAKIQQQALENLDRRRDLHRWSRAQDNLGNIMIRQCIRMKQSGSKDEESLRNNYAVAGKAFKAALRGRSRNADPESWSRINFHLATALRLEASYFSNDADKVRFLKVAIKSYEEAWRAISYEDSPKHHAQTADDFGGALSELATLSKGRKSRRLLERSVEVLETAGQNFDRRIDTPLWVSLKLELGKSLRLLAEMSPEKDMALNYYGVCVQRAEEAIGIADEESLELAQVGLRMFLGRVYFEMVSRLSEGELADTLLEKAIRIYEDGVRKCKGEASHLKEDMDKVLASLREFGRKRSESGDAS